MPFQFQCSNCGQAIGAQDHQAGTAIACPSCGAQQVVQAAQPMNPGTPQQYGSSPQQFGSSPQQYGASPQQFGAPQQYGAPPQQFGAPQQYGAPPQQFGAPYQYQVDAPQKEGIGGRILGILGFIAILLLINAVTYFGCGYIVY